LKGDSTQRIIWGIGIFKKNGGTHLDRPGTCNFYTQNKVKIIILMELSCIIYMVCAIWFKILISREEGDFLGMLQKIREFIEKNDRLIKLFDMKIERVKRGYSKVSMIVKENHLNAALVCHGGTIFSLADVAFALASNSHGTIALAIDVSISYLKAVRAGEKITAICREKHLGRNIGVYEIEIINDQNELVSLLKATAFRKNEPLIS